VRQANPEVGKSVEGVYWTRNWTEVQFFSANRGRPHISIKRRQVLPAVWRSICRERCVLKEETAMGRVPKHPPCKNSWSSFHLYVPLSGSTSPSQRAVQFRLGRFTCPSCTAAGYQTTYEVLSSSKRGSNQSGHFPRKSFWGDSNVVCRQSSNWPHRGRQHTSIRPVTL